ncbi:MAG: HDIG domain-containing protein [Gemmatimonadota bacterium]|nr:MAG: HDIG domain-containing protein [Gemmatimonadota bacterium]
MRYFLGQLRRRPAARVIDEAYRVVLLVSAALIIHLVFPTSPVPDLPVLEEGRVAGEDVIASVTFPVYKSDTELTRERAEAASGMSPIFQYRPEIADSAIANAATFFELIERSASEATGDAERERAVRQVLERYRIPSSENQVPLLLSAETRERLQAAMQQAFRELLRPGVASNSELGTARSGGVIVREGADERLVARDSLPTMQVFFQRAAAQAPAEAGVAAHTLYQNLIIRFSQPSIRLDRERTEEARDQARQTVDPVKYEVLQGERIVGAHERVGPAEMERLRAYEAALAELDGGQAWEAHLGGVLYTLLLLAVFGLVLKYFRPEVYQAGRSISLVWILLMAVAGAAALVSSTGAPQELIPVAFAALMLSTLFDGLLALVTVFVLVALVAARPPLLGMTVPFLTIMGGAAAALSGRMLRRRAQTWTIAALIAGAYLVAAVSLGLINRLGAGWMLQSAFWGTLNGVGCTLLAAGVLPLAELFTQITTDQSLLELVDMNRPLLRRLSLEAPGTYAHSINAANLAEAAARAIGANSLLVRVGVYYHDIGKVNKPQFFVENQPPGRNPHDKLKPATSANIVREHVEDGLELADGAGLPGVVKAFITEHHGTQRIGFFWEKAQELDPDADLDLSDFRYPGPKPQSKETAIALLADSVESAARVLHDPTPTSIAEMVDRIVGFKMSEGQLDQAPLTLREVSLIKGQFAKVLTSMYHHRLDYPLQNQQAPKAEEPAAHGTP